MKNYRKNKKGKLIILEGTDGSGKTVQFERLLKHLRKMKIKTKSLDFPRYNKDSSYFVKQYLKGNYGDWKEVSAYRASLFYALDRFAALNQLNKWLEDGEVVISNRYVASNLGHQGLKVKNSAGRKKFYQWLYNLEYNILGLPLPDLNIFLHVPAEIAFKLISHKKKREYLGNKKRDIHEKDILHLKKAEKIFCEVVELYPQDFKSIECVRQGKMLSKDEIEEKIWKSIQHILKK